ncbi:MAG: PEP-CTERM sorting domain-containing protein, partial [Abditibacteriota bacterium]|nr:PEP-CTERM sorting domain-containing protein [Abditibacteriota bacterium]
TVHADPEIWADSKANSPVILRDGESPWVAFQSNTVSPGLMINYKDTVSFAVNITGFNDLVFYRWGEPTETGKNILVSFADSDNKSVSYRTSWTGDGLYEFGYNQIVSYRPQLSDIEVSEVYIYLGTTSTTNIPDSYHLGDNTAGTIEFIFPDAEVPEPSSLLALAFGGAGIVGFAFRRR